MTSTFRVFPNDPIPPYVSHADGLHIYTKDGRKLLDATAGGTSYSILGWNHPIVNSALESQLKRFGHLDYKL
jgi:4-aminobutyrate aminotransferase-like enzyme